MSRTISRCNGAWATKEYITDRGTKHSERYRGRQDNSIEYPAVFVRDQFTEDDGEGQLSRRSNTVDAVGCDQHLNGLRARPNDITHDRQQAGAGEEPPSAEDVGEASNPEESDGETSLPGYGKPDGIGTGAESCVDEGNGVGREDPTKVTRDLSEASRDECPDELG